MKREPRMKWFKDEDLPDGARVIAVREVPVRYEPTYGGINVVSGDEYLVDMQELSRSKSAMTKWREAAKKGIK